MTTTDRLVAQLDRQNARLDRMYTRMKADEKRYAAAIWRAHEIRSKLRAARGG
jgi:hypothetical protein